MATGLSFGNNNRTTDFTTEVERLDNEYDFVGQVLNFEERTTAHANITFDITDKKIVIPQGNKRGAGDFTKGQEKDVTPLNIFLDYIRQEDFITKNDFLDYRLPGTSAVMDNVTAVRLDKFSGLVNNVNNSIEYKRLSAVTGVSKDAYGNVQADLYTATGTSQTSVDLLLGTASTDVGGLLTGAIRTVGDNFRMGSRIPAMVCFCGDELFDKLLAHPQTVEALKYHAAPNEPLRNATGTSEVFGMVNNFTYKGIRFVNYNPSFNILDANGRDTTTTKAMADNEGFLVPAGVSDMFRTYWGPSQQLDAVAGSRIHAKEYISDDGETWKVIIENADLHFCTNPTAIVRLTTSN